MASVNGLDFAGEIVLEVGSEGGSLALLRVKDSSGAWRFRVDRDETTYYDILSEEDLSSLGPERFAQSEYADSLEDALKLFDRYKWFRFTPIEIHPEFLNAILLEVRKRGADEEVDRWKEFTTNSQNQLDVDDVPSSDDPTGPSTSNFRIAVFTRNHETHLKEAHNRTQPTAFQSKKRWVSAQKALRKQKTLMVYIAPIGEQKVTYEGTITEIALRGSAEMGKLLAARGEETKNEELWGETVYLVSNCCPISGVPLSKLRKACDGSPLSDDFKYSYSLVRERDEPADSAT